MKSLWVLYIDIVFQYEPFPGRPLQCQFSVHCIWNLIGWFQFWLLDSLDCFEDCPQSHPSETLHTKGFALQYWELPCMKSVFPSVLASFWIFWYNDPNHSLFFCEWGRSSERECMTTISPQLRDIYWAIERENVLNVANPALDSLRSRVLAEAIQDFGYFMHLWVRARFRLCQRWEIDNRPMATSSPDWPFREHF